MTKRAAILWTVGVMGISAVAAWIYAALQRWDRPLALREADSALAAYRAVGLPWEVSDMPKGDTGPKSAAAFALRMRTKFDYVGYSEYSTDVMEPLLAKGSYREAYRRFRSKFGDTVDLCRGQRDKETLGLPMDWINTAEDDAAAAAVAGAVELMAESGRLEYAKGDPEQALADFRMSRKLILLARQYPNFDQIRESANHAESAYDEMIKCAIQARGDVSFLQELRTLAEDFPQIDFTPFLRYECWSHLALMRRSSPAEDRDGFPQVSLDRALLVRQMQAWTRFYPKALPLVRKPWELSQEAARQSADWVAHKGETFEDVSPLPDLEKLDVALNVFDASAMVLRAEIEALLMEHRTGRLPQSIRDLPGVWIDPIDGQPLRMRRSDKYLLIYSISFDEVDNNGLTWDDPAAGDDYDMVAKIPLQRP